MSNNIEDLIQLLSQTKDELLAAIQQAKINPNQVQLVALSDLSKVLGLVQAGEFRSGNGNQPGSGFTGMRMAYPPMIYSGLEWNLIGANNDVLKFGINAANGEAWAGGGNVRLTDGGILIYNGTTLSGKIGNDGNVAFGSDLSTPASTSILIFSKVTTYNGEVMSAGDILLGDNSTGKPNLFWDASAGILYLRSGTLNVGRMSSNEMLAGIGCRHTANNNSVPDGGAALTYGNDAYSFDDANFFDGGDPTNLTIPQDGRYFITINGSCGVSYNDEGYVSLGCIGGPSTIEQGAKLAALTGIFITTIGMSASGELFLTAGTKIRSWYHQFFKTPATQTCFADVIIRRTK